MVDVLAGIVIAASLLAAGWTGLLAVRSRLPRGRTILALAAVEALVVVQLLVAAVLLALGQRPADLATYIGYHLTALLVLPAGVAWSITDRSRYSPVVLTVAALTVAALTVRLLQLGATA